MTEVRYDRAVGEADVPALVRLVNLAFASQPKYAEAWLRSAGLEHQRVLRDGSGAPVACVMRIPMGHWLGGRSVPTIGVAAVAVSPERRGGGLGLLLMRSLVREMHEEGAALSSLYASTQSLYRQVGYEQAALRFEHRLSMRDLRLQRDAGAGGRRGTLAAREIAPSEDRLIRACAAAHFPLRHGSLDRGEYIWKRVWKMREDEFRCFGLHRPGSPDALEAYVFLRHARKPDGWATDVVVNDYAYTTPDSARDLVRFLASLATTGEDLVFQDGPASSLALLLDHMRGSVERRDPCMLRITHVPTALEARGWPAGFDGALTLNVRDELLPGNDGAWALRISRGRASVARAERGGAAVTLDARALAPVYTGLLSASQAAALGWASGAPEALSLADAAFASPAPGLPDMF